MLCIFSTQRCFSSVLSTRHETRNVWLIQPYVLHPRQWPCFSLSLRQGGESNTVPLPDFQTAAQRNTHTHIQTQKNGAASIIEWYFTAHVENFLCALCCSFFRIRLKENHQRRAPYTLSLSRSSTSWKAAFYGGRRHWQHWKHIKNCNLLYLAAVSIHNSEQNGQTVCDCQWVLTRKRSVGRWDSCSEEPCEFCVCLEDHCLGTCQPEENETVQTI